MTTKDDTTALLMERQILQDNFPLACGCVLMSKYGHPTQQGWRLVHTYDRACAAHTKIATSFEKERSQDWDALTDTSFLPGWRDEHGLWIQKAEWFSSRFYAPGHGGAFEYKGQVCLVLVGYLGTPVVLGDNKGEKMAGRIISLNLRTGKIFPAPVPDHVLQEFGWTSLKG